MILAMLPFMNTKMLPHVVPMMVVVALAFTSACSDQGAVKSETPKPAAASTAQPSQPMDASQSQAPQPVSAHGDTPQQLPPGHPPLDANTPMPGGLPPVPEGAGTGAAALAWTIPAGWITETPASPMRRAQYKVPGKAGDGECAVFYFGPGQGGDPMSNAQRWADQFVQPDGKPAASAMKTSEIEVSGFKVFMVEVAGTYKGGMTMTAMPASPKPGYRLLGAVAPGPDANWYFKFTGPDETVSEQRAAFTSMVKSLKRGAS
jgi:hypothetical protein